jgi:rubrerythrin
MPRFWKACFRKPYAPSVTWFKERGEGKLSSNNELVGFIKRQIIIEKEIVESLNKGIANIKNPPVRGVLKGISLDSVKHAELYSAAVSLLTNVSQALKQENLDEQRALVEKHIKMEAELIKKLEKIMPTIESNKVQFLLNSILADERRHHALLKTILEIIVHGETITEADWWKMLWENVPFHGAPGG